jgi:hypothetical protein
MDILSNYRISALITSERDLAVTAERARIASERAARRTRREPVTTTTGSVVAIPSTSH